MNLSGPPQTGDDLPLQQLRQLKFWSDRAAGAASSSAEPGEDAPPTLLDAADLDRLQQLLQAETQRPPPPLARAAAPGPAGASGHLPERWALTQGVTLHPWQQECVAHWFAARGRGVIKVVTGAGKTMLALAIIERLQQTLEPALVVAIVVPTIVLLDQWREELLARSNLPAGAIGQMGGGQDDSFSTRTRILICVLNSAARKLPAMVTSAGLGSRLLLVVDECHRAGASEMQKVFSAPRAFSLGLSATPERENDQAPGDDEEDRETSGAEPTPFLETTLGQQLGPVIFELNYAEAISLGVLPPFGIRHYGLTLRPKENTLYEKASRELKDLRDELERPGRKGLGLLRWCRSAAAAGNPAAGRLIGLSAERKRLLFRMEERARAVVHLLRAAFAENPQTKAILFHESIEEVMRIFALLRTEGFPVIAEHSEFPEPLRAAALRLFRHGTAQVIISAKSLIEGFNVPSADLGIIIAATSSVRQRVQTLGRLLRKGSPTAGPAKESLLHVLYASGTVDEMIYAKADWERFVGAERNQYFLWPDVAAAPPQPTGKAPRAPAPTEVEVDEASLQPGETYPGNLDQGRGYTRDSQGTVRHEDGLLTESHPELRAILKRSRRAAGRFRVTPARWFVVELDKTPEGWRGLYLGRLTTPITLVPAADDSSVADQDWRPGASYPLPRATGKIFSVLQRDPRLIALKVKGQPRFVHPLTAITDPEKRTAQAKIQAFLKSAYAKGHQVSKIVVTAEGHVVYIYQNEAVFVGLAPEGPEGFTFEPAPNT